MIALKRILLPTDFSDYSAEATKYACALADEFGAELHVLHVTLEISSQVPDFGMGLAFPAFRENVVEIRESIDAEAKAKLNRVLDPEWEKGRRIVRALRHGAPFVEIIRYAKDQNIDMIVIATHGRTGLPHVLLGSVSEKVVRKSPCPVLTVRPAGHQFVMP